MARHSLYPGFIRIRYTGAGHIHYMTIPVRPFEAVGGGWWVVLKGNPVGEVWTAFVTALVNVIKPLMNTADEVQVAHLWTFASEDSDPVFQEEFNVSTIGTSAGAAVLYSQSVYTFRTTLGGLMRFYHMEDTQSVNSKVYPPLGAGSAKNLSDFIMGTSSAVVGRDGAFLSSLVSLTTKTNDALRKKFLLAQ